MFKRWYKLTGITNELFEQWKDELRTDIIWCINKNTKGIEPRIRLTTVGAARMKRQIKEYNGLNTGCILGLKRV